MASNEQIADLFDTYVYWMSTSGTEASYKISTYKNAAYVIRNSGFELCTASPKDIKSLKGIGDALRTTIIQICQQNQFPELDNLLESIPEGVQEMSQISGLGPKKINTLWREYGIDSIPTLKDMIESGALLKIKGFGKASVDKIYKNLIWLQENKHNQLYAQVAQLSLEIQQYFSHLFPDHTFILCGDIAHRSNVVRSIDLLTDLKTSEAREEISLLDKISSIEEHHIVLDFNGARVRLIEHTDNSSLSQEAHRINYTLEDKLLEDDRPVFQVETYFQDRVPNSENLIETSDIRGLIHAHSTYSDGENTLEEMAQQCIDMGLEYMVITDHSQSAFYAHGLSPERIKEQSDEIDTLNRSLHPFRIFKSIECDILTDGSLDYEHEVLKRLDIVIASIHSGLSMDKLAATQRIIKAIEHPSTDILGHMTARLLLRREGYPVDIVKIAEACIKNRVAIEINANPRRLDVDAYYIPYLLDMGVKLSVNPDAHRIQGIDDIQWGIVNAQKGGVQKKDNISSLSLAEFLKYYNIS